MPVSDFGRMADGSAVEAITIAADGIEAKVLTFGATLADLVVTTPAGPRSVILGFDDLDGYLGHGGYFGAIAGRCANRIAGGRFSLDGQEYQLDLNEGWPDASPRRQRWLLPPQLDGGRQQRNLGPARPDLARRRPGLSRQGHRHLPVFARRRPAAHRARRPHRRAHPGQSCAAMPISISTAQARSSTTG